MISALIGWPARRPMFALIALVLIAALGAVSFSHWPIERLPSARSTLLRVHAELPGVDVLQAESAVAIPLENIFVSLPGLRDITSRAREGRATLELRFASATERDSVFEEARQRIDRATFALPSGADPLVLEREEPRLRPAVVYAVTADKFSDEFAAWTESALAQPIRQLADVGTVSIVGADTHEVLIEPDARRLAALGLSFDDVIKAVRGSDEAPRRRAMRRDAVRMPATVEAIAARAVRLPDGDMLALGEIAKVSVVTLRATERPRHKGASALLLRVYPKSPSAAVAAAERVATHIGWLRANGLVRSGVEIHSLLNEADETRHWYRSIRRLAAGYLALIFLAVYLFFGWRTGSAYVGAVVAWLLASAGVFWIGGFALNVITMAALVLACVPLTLAIMQSLSSAVAVLAAVAATLFLIGEVIPSSAQIAVTFSIASLAAIVVTWFTRPWLNRDGNVSALLARVPPLRAHRWPRLLRVSLTMMLISIAAGIFLRVLLVTAPQETDEEFIVRIGGEDVKQLVASGEGLLAQLGAIKNVDNIETSWALQRQWQLQLDPDRMVESGLSLASVGRALAIAREGLVVGEVVDADARLALRIRSAPDTSGPRFERLLLQGEYKDRRAMYLRDVGSVQWAMLPRESLRMQQLPAVEIRGRSHAPEATKALIGFNESVSLPAGYSIYVSVVPGVADLQDRR